jgi:hypothetical protein
VPDAPDTDNPVQAQSPDTSRSSRLRLAALIAVAVVITILTWPITRLDGPVGLDASWIAALHLAARDGLRFGHDIVFTYGPLGFLGLPQPQFGTTSVLAAVVVFAITSGTWLLVLLSLARMLPIAVAAALTLVIASSGPWMLSWDLAVLGAFLAATWLVADAAHGTHRIRWAIGFACLAGAGLLTKLNNGALVALLSVAVAFAVARPGSRLLDVARCGAAGAAGFLLGWLATGQQLADLPNFLRLSSEGILGYSGAMSTDLGPAAAWRYSTFLVAAIVFVWLAWRSSEDWPRDRRWLSPVVAAMFLFFTFKTAFVRMDHVMLGFAALPVALAAFASASRQRERWALGFGVVLSAFVAAGAVGPRALLPTLESPKQFAEQAADLVDAQRRGDRPFLVRATMRAAYGLDERALALLKGHTVHIEPWEAGVAMAYPDVSWRPLPAFQGYQAYTRALDDFNASFLESEAAPERILRLLPATIDGRNPWFDSPATKLVMICRYIELDAGDTWQVLGRVDNRCGPPAAINSLNLAAGDVMDVPVIEGDVIVLARVHLPSATAVDGLRAFLFKPETWRIQVNGGFENRLIAATATGPLILTAPASLGYSEAFAIGAPVFSLRLIPPPVESGSVTVDFFAIRMGAEATTHASSAAR